MRTVSAANEDLQRVSDKLSEEIESKHVEQFSQAQNDVELVIGTERDELDAWLLSCNGDCKNIGENILLKRAHVCTSYSVLSLHFSYLEVVLVFCIKMAIFLCC